MVGLLGPNGAGKSSLIRSLPRCWPPSGGSVSIGRWDPARMADRVEIRRRLGYLPQERGLYPRFTAFQFVDYLAVLKELKDPAERHRRVQAALEAVDLAGGGRAQAQAALRRHAQAGGSPRRSWPDRAAAAG